MKRPPTLAKKQSGILLLEALIAILVFSLGILAIIAFQTASVRLTRDAKYRTDATLLANQLIGEMWVSGGDLAALQTAFQTDGSAYNTWLAKVSGKDGLPGVAAASGGTISTTPTVSVDTTAGATAGLVTITLFWRTPDMPLDKPGHRHIVVSQITRN